MIKYYIKEDDYVYRFTGWPSFLEMTKKQREEYGNSLLILAIASEFPKGTQIVGHGAAMVKGWLTTKGDLVPSLKKGNSWGKRNLEVVK
jgi:hypothetical protein